MTNDTTTIAGALQECIDHLENNLSSMGVDATYSSTDGVIGLIDEITNIAPSVGGLELTTSIDITKDKETVGSGENLTLFATVNGDYDDTSQTNIDLKGYLQGATVTFKEGNTVLGTAITNNNGIATYIINNITAGNHTYTALFNGDGTDYNSATETITLTALSYILYDNCTVDNTAQYSTTGKISTNNVSTTLVYNTTEEAYKFSGSGGDSFSFREIPNTRGLNNIRITCKVKINNNSAYSQFLIGLTDTLNTNADPNTAGTYTGDFVRIRGDNKADNLHNGGGEVSNSTKSSLSLVNNYVYLVMERQGTSIVRKIYDDNEVLLHTFTYTTPNTYSNPYYLFGVNCRYSTYNDYIKMIKVESI